MVTGGGVEDRVDGVGRLVEREEVDDVRGEKRSGRRKG